MKGVFLDKLSLDRQDLDFTRLDQLAINWTYYSATQFGETGSRVADADVIITNKVIIDESLLSQCSKLKLICVAATGTNNVDLKAARKHNISVCNVQHYAEASVAQHVFTLLLNLVTHLPQYQRAVQEGEWSKSDQFCLLDYPITELAGKKLGIIGYGNLGKAVAKIAEAFGMEILIGQSLTGINKPGRLSLKELLCEADVLTLHCPLTEQTRNLINGAAFKLMKPTAYLINTARGGIVNEAALLHALQQKQIAGAALDVLSIEPPSPDHILLKNKLNNLIITPHIAWASKESRQRLLDELITNIQSFLSDTPRNIVN